MNAHSSTPHPYPEGIVAKILSATGTQLAALRSAADRLAALVVEGGVLHVLGSGHSHLVAQELFARAGGPLFVNPVADPRLTVLHPSQGSRALERLPGHATALLDQQDIQAVDALLVVSNSGRNSVPVEAALYARDRGLYTLAVTSLAHSRSVVSRHPSGRRLCEVVDVSFDNHADPGDAQVALAGSNIRYGPVSTIVSMVLAQTLMCCTIEALHRDGHAPPVLRSANLDGVDEHNDALRARYADRIPLHGAR